MRLVPEARTFEVGRPLRLCRQVADRRDERGPVIAGAGRAGQAGKAPRAGRRPPPCCRGCAARRPGRCPATAAATRKPATRSRGFSTKRSSASMSLTCAASRNFRPPNFTNGMLRRVSSISSGPLWMRRAEQHRLLLQASAFLAVFEDALDDVARLVGLVAHGDQSRLSPTMRARSRGSW